MNKQTKNVEASTFELSIAAVSELDGQREEVSCEVKITAQASGQSSMHLQSISLATALERKALDLNPNPDERYALHVYAQTPQSSKQRITKGTIKNGAIRIFSS